MPEYLSPGVYIEETSYRAKSIEGVSTTTAGFVGQCRFGPVRGQPVLITSFEEFRRSFGGLDDLNLGGVETTNYLAHSVKAFFDNGGQRVYIARVFNGVVATSMAQADVPGFAAGRFRARYPGLAGNVAVRISGSRSKNLLSGTGAARRLNGVRAGDIVEVSAGVDPLPTVIGVASPLSAAANLYWVEISSTGVISLDQPGLATPITDFTALVHAQRVAVRVEVIGPERTDSYANLSVHPDSAGFIGSVLRTEDPANSIEPPYDRAAVIWLQLDAGYAPASGLTLLASLLAPAAAQLRLSGGIDGAAATPANYEGGGTGADVTGLAALREIEDIAIVAAPSAAGMAVRADRQSVRNALIAHCELLKYRFAILSDALNAGTEGIREVRAQHDSTYAALYHPWVRVRDPFGQSGDLLALPPDGFMAGIYARSDIARGVHKAPANEVVRGAIDFSAAINKGVQDVLNPEGINCLRFFEGRGYLVWGARTISSDPEWTYLNVRRLFIYLEHSIDRATQWAVFEPNNEQLWLKIRLTVESFLTDVWRTGALMGKTREEAFFVKCDRTTMSQGDLDNGRLVCLIGLAPTKPAEFVIFRIGQWTADASIL